jgi:uncharacterized protein YjbI with pentapeptide repeats
MTKSPKLPVEKPKSILDKEFKLDSKGLFKSLAHAATHAATGKWEELGNDAAETLAAIGAETKPGELAYLLIKRAIAKSLFQIVGESVNLLGAMTPPAPDELIKLIDLSALDRPFTIDHEFFDHPRQLPLLSPVKSVFAAWLENFGLNRHAAEGVANRLPSYFTYALHEEWRRNARSFKPILEAFDTPFVKAGEIEWAWMENAAALRRKADECVFDEPFSLFQIYIPLNAYHAEDQKDRRAAAGSEPEKKKIVVALEAELLQWLAVEAPKSAIRVISGGPGSGKSSFLRIFAAKAAMQNHRVLFIPLHLIDPSREIIDEVGRFLAEQAILPHNPLDQQAKELTLLVIFDGLDELASQGKAAKETAANFVRAVEKLVELRNAQKTRLRILLSGRELVVQENESEFRQTGQILTLLPYCLPEKSRGPFQDRQRLLKTDHRQHWWKNYGELTGKGFTGLPPELDRDDLAEITTQPLLNYLLALSFSRGKLDFTGEVNLNRIYYDLVEAIYDRAYEKRGPYRPVKHMSFADFFRVLEEVALAAWHGDGRSVTIKEIEVHCQAAGLSRHLESFQEGAKQGVTRLLAAFFFRQYEQLRNDDATFVFTHKSFGEYLAALRLVRAIKRTDEEFRRRQDSPDAGWDEREALKHWVAMCGPSAMTLYIHDFLEREISSIDMSVVESCRAQLCRLFNYMLKHASPMERFRDFTFKQALFHSRNAEEALLAAMCACAIKTLTHNILIEPEPGAFGYWLKRIQDPSGNPLAASFMSYLFCRGTNLFLADLYRANLKNTILMGANLRGANLQRARLQRADLTGADLSGAVLTAAGLQSARLTGANLSEAIMTTARLQRTNLRGTNLTCADLRGVDLRGADLAGADLTGADLTDANLTNAILSKATLSDADLTSAILSGANLSGADLTNADLSDAFLAGAKLTGANLTGAKVTPEQLAKAKPSWRLEPPA